MEQRSRRSGRPTIGIVLLAVVAGLVFAGFAFGALRQTAAPLTPTRAASVIPTAPTVATRRVSDILPGAEPTDTHQAEVRDVDPIPVPKKSVPATVAVPVKKKAAVASGPSIDAYRGLGSWVDIYDDRAWKDPAAAVRDMSRHGVRTLYLETGNSHSNFTMKDPAKTAVFIREAHRLEMRVVAWYLPEMTNTGMDYDRIAAAIRFRTSDGQKFDSFALDIESSKVASVPERNKRLDAMSNRIRKLVGSRYPLGAIIPSPGAMAKNGGYWHAFPYAKVAAVYDVFVPMSYYSYHGDGASAARADTLLNMRSLRAQPGCAKEPVHLIGGIDTKSTPAEVRAFVQAGRETGAIGASLYSWDGTNAGHWGELKAVRP